MTETGLLFATLTLIGYGISPVLSKQAVKFHDARSVSIVVHFLGTLIIILFLGRFLSLDSIDFLTFILILATSAVGAANVFVLYMAIIRAPISIVIPIVSTNSIFVLLVSVVYFNESLSFWKWIGIALTIAGAYLVVADYRKLRHIREKNLEWKGVLFAFLSSILFVVYNSTSKHITDLIGGINSTLIMEFFVLIFMLAIIAILRHPLKLPRGKGFFYTVGSGLFFALGAGFFYISIENAGLALTAGVVAGAPDISAIIGRLFLNEKLGMQKNIGAVMVILGILFVQLL